MFGLVDYLLFNFTIPGTPGDLVGFVVVIPGASICR